MDDSRYSQDNIDIIKAVWVYRHKRWCWPLWSIICLQHVTCSLCLLSDCFGLIRSHFVQPLVVKVKMWHVEKTCQTKKHPHQALRGPIALPYPGQIWYGPIVGCIEFAVPFVHAAICSKNECSNCAKPRCVICSPSWGEFQEFTIRSQLQFTTGIPGRPSCGFTYFSRQKDEESED